MSRVAVDTNVLVGATLKRDQHHEKATEIVRGIDRGELPDAVVNNYVVAETLNLVGGRATNDKATELYDRLVRSAGFEVVHAIKKDFTTAEEVF